MNLSENSEKSLTQNSEKWYTIEELSSLSGISVETLKGGHSPLNELSIGIETETKMGGYHNTKKFYSENVLKALKQYQLRNSVPNAVKDKETAIQGNISMVQNQTVKATIDNLLDNPDTLNMLLTESLARNKALGIENMQLKEVVAIQKPKVEVYDAICDSSTLQDLQTVAITIGLKNIFKVLLADEILEEKYTNDNQHYYKPKAEYSQYLVLKDGKPWKDENGNIKVRPRVFVTGKGLNWLTRKYQSKESK